MAFHQFNRLDGAPLLPPLKVRFRWDFLFIFLLVSWWKSTSGSLLCLLVCRVLAAMCEKDEQYLLLLLPPFFFKFCLCLLSISLWGLGETAPKQDHHSNCGMMASQRQPDSVEWCISLYLSLFLSVCVCACVYVLCVHLGVGIISQPKKKIEKKNIMDKSVTLTGTWNPPCTHSAVIYVHTQIYTNTVTW